MKQILFITLTSFFLSLISSCTRLNQAELVAEQWNEVELEFHSNAVYQNPYTDVDFWVEFKGPSGEKLVRPGFWDGEKELKFSFLKMQEFLENSLVKDMQTNL